MFVVCLATHPYGAAAQYKNKTPEQMLAEVRADPFASRFYETIKGRELDLALIRFGALVVSRPTSPDSIRIGPAGRFVHFVFVRNGTEIVLTVDQYESIEHVKGHFDIHSNASQEPYTRHGDRGVKSYYGGFRGLSFSRGRFFVSISTADEKLAERFAGYTDETITPLLN